MNRTFLVLMSVFLAGTCVAVAAQVPVVDLGKVSQQETVTSSGGLEIDQEETTPIHASLNHREEPLDQRVVQLERQIANLAEMNIASKLEKVQQDMQQLRGTLEVQSHDLAQLKEQLRTFYQDLDQRLSKLTPEDSQTTSSLKKSMSAKNEDKKNKKAADSHVSEDKSDELQTYETAFNLLNKKEYEKAIAGFQSFVKTYPKSSYTVNAHYWLGEIFYLKGSPDSANKEFQTIIANYPENPKVADAMLKVALISMDAGNYSKAKQHLTKVQKQFPGTTAAKIATLRLKELKQKK